MESGSKCYHCDANLDAAVTAETMHCTRCRSHETVDAGCNCAACLEIFCDRCHGTGMVPLNALQDTDCPGCGDQLKTWRCTNNICALEWDGYEEPSECPACKSINLKEI